MAPLSKSQIYDLYSYYRMSRVDHSLKSALFLLSYCHLSIKSRFRDSHCHPNDTGLGRSILSPSASAGCSRPSSAAAGGPLETHRTINSYLLLAIASEHHSTRFHLSDSWQITTPFFLTFLAGSFCRCFSRTT